MSMFRLPTDKSKTEMAKSIEYVAVYTPTALDSYKRLLFSEQIALPVVRCLVQSCRKSPHSRARISGTVVGKNMQLAPAWTQKFK